MWKVLGQSLVLTLGMYTTAVAQEATGVETKRVKTIRVRPDGTPIPPFTLDGIIRSPKWLIVCKSPELLKLLVNRQLAGEFVHIQGCWKLPEDQKTSVTSDFGEIVYALTQTWEDPSMKWEPMWTYKHWLSGNMSLRVPRN